MKEKALFPSRVRLLWAQGQQFIRRYPAALSLLVVLLCGLWTLWPLLRQLAATPVRDIVAGDTVDTGAVVAGLTKVRSAADIVAWWYGPWVAGHDYAFYRPLTSTIWYLEYRLFGYNGFHGFQLIHFFSHLMVLLAMLLFFGELLNRRLATIATCLFTLAVAYRLFNLPGPIYALALWKDDPEMWLSCTALLSLWCYLRYLRGGKRRDAVYALVGFVAAVAIKEMAYVIPLLLALLLWHEQKWRTHWQSLLPFLGTATALALFRCWALGGSGYNFGTNGSWKQRWFINVVGGEPGSHLLMEDWLPFAVACTIFVLAGLYRRTWRFAAGWALVSAVSFGIAAHQWVGLDGPFYYPLLSGTTPWFLVLNTLLLLMGYYRFALTRRPGQIMGWLWVVISYIPLMTAPITYHALYFVAIGWSVWITYYGFDLWEWGKNWNGKPRFEST